MPLPLPLPLEKELEEKTTREEQELGQPCILFLSNGMKT